MLGIIIDTTLELIPVNTKTAHEIKPINVS